MTDENGRIQQLQIEIARLQEKLAAKQTATELQAAEYERRLTALNHAHEEAREIQKVTVTRQVFDEYVKVQADRVEQAAKTEAEKRELALQRVDEKFTDYVKRYEQRQREVDNALTIQKTASDAAKAFAAEASQKANRNIALLGVGVTAVILVVNIVTGNF